MMKDDKIHIPCRKRRYTEDKNCVIKISREAYNAIVDVYNESLLSMKQIASLIILESVDRIVFDKGEE